MTEIKKPIKKPRGVARLIDGKCIACGARCQSSCPVNCIEMTDSGEPVVDAGKCIGCQKCLKVCPASALEMWFTPEELKILAELAGQSGDEAAGEPDEETRQLQKMLAMYRGVWVVVEQFEGVVAKVSWELLGTGAELAGRLGVPLSAVIIGRDIGHLAGESFEHGADRAILLNAPVYTHYRTQPYTDAICHLIDKHKPEVILMGATAQGRDLAGAVATVVGTGLTADCTGLGIDDQRNLMQTRPAFGGNIMATIMCDKYRPQMATVRPHVMPMPTLQPGRSGEVISELFAPREEDVLVKVLEVISDRDGKDQVDVAAAEIIVSGGRGLMNKENFALLQELADELGGVVARREAPLTPAGFPTADRWARQVRPSARRSTLPVVFPGPSSTWSVCRTRMSSSPSTGTRKLRSSRSPLTGSSGTFSRLCPPSSAGCVRKNGKAANTKWQDPLPDPENYCHEEYCQCHSIKQFS